MLVFGGTLSATSHAQIILTDGNFPYNDRVFINPGSGTFGAGNVHIQNTAPVEINYAGPGGNGHHALAVEHGARLDVDNAISMTTNGSAGHALLVTDGGKAYFSGDMKAENTNVSNTYYAAAVNVPGSVLQVDGKAEIIAPMGSNNSNAAFYSGAGTSSTFNGEAVIRGGSQGVYSVGTTVFNGKTDIQVLGNAAGGVITATNAAGSVTFNDDVMIKSTPVSDTTTGYNYGIYASGNRVYLNQGGTIDTTHGFANSASRGVYALNSGVVDVKNGAFNVLTTQNNRMSFALYAASAGKITVQNAKVNLSGNIYATGANSIISVKTNPGSALDADTNMANGGVVNLDLSQTDWQLRSSSVLNILEGTGSDIRFAQPVAAAPVFNTLTVNKLSGSGHIFYLNTVLDDGSSQLTDQLVINDTASGVHQLHINNVDGAGEATQQGIKVVDIQSTVSSNTATFTLANTVVANAYEYLLAQNSADRSWYLNSRAYDPSVPIYRPDVGVNTVNDDVLVDLSVPGFGYSGGKRWMEFQRTPEKSNDLWVSVNGNRIEGRAAMSEVKYKADLWGMSIGGDRRIEAGKGIVHIGAMASVAGADSSARNHITGSKATGSVEGYALGVYGTWYLKDAEDEPVPYIDGLISYGRYDNEVSTKGNPKSSYDSAAFAASMQVGYPLRVTNSVAIEPQMQLTYVNTSTDDYVDHSGTRVSTQTNGHLISRVGAYVYRTDGKVRPYAGLSLWHDPTYATVRYTDHHGQTSVSGYKRGLIVDARVGVRGQLNRSWDVWAEGGYRRGRHGFDDANVTFGVNYSF